MVSIKVFHIDRVVSFYLMSLALFMKKLTFTRRPQHLALPDRMVGNERIAQLLRWLEFIESKVSSESILVEAIAMVVDLPQG